MSIARLAARRWWLTRSREDTIAKAADDPDTYEAGIDNSFNQQWSHAYIYSDLGLWMWGDANENFDDCITGTLSEQPEGPECRDGKSARTCYASGNQRLGDTYLGYALHYIADVSLVLHSSNPVQTPDLGIYHLRSETWVKNNWTDGHRFQATVAADGYYYPITDLQQAVRNAAWSSSFANSSSAGRMAWIGYRDSGYPSAAGQGSASLVYATRLMLIRAARYTAGAIEYTLGAYDQWEDEY